MANEEMKEHRAHFDAATGPDEEWLGAEKLDTGNIVFTISQYTESWGTTAVTPEEARAFAQQILRMTE